MTQHRFLHISLEFDEPRDTKKIHETFDKALDWIRYAPNCWLVWTTSSPQKWYSRLKKHLDKGDHLFICEMNISERSGWMPSSFWDFIRSHS